LAAVALANKTARIAWKLIVSGERYNAAHQRVKPIREGRRAPLNEGSAASPLARAMTVACECERPCQIMTNST
jgi:hypothetical protein